MSSRVNEIVDKIKALPLTTFVFANEFEGSFVSKRTVITSDYIESIKTFLGVRRLYITYYPGTYIDGVVFVFKL